MIKSNHSKNVAMRASKSFQIYRLSGTTAKVVLDAAEVLIEESPVRFGGKHSHVRQWCVGSANFQSLKAAIVFAKDSLIN